MQVPSSNLLAQALTVIKPQVVKYFQNTGRTTNAIGNDVSTYAAGVDIKGSWQSLSRTLYQQLGLDLQKRYYTFYATKDILDVERDVSGDQLEFSGKRYQVLSDTSEWFNVDGWTGVLCVELKAVA